MPEKEPGTGTKTEFRKRLNKNNFFHERQHHSGACMEHQSTPPGCGGDLPPLASHSPIDFATFLQPALQHRVNRR
jgi:hypothetical protein